MTDTTTPGIREFWDVVDDRGRHIQFQVEGGCDIVAAWSFALQLMPMDLPIRNVVPADE